MNPRATPSTPHFAPTLVLMMVAVGWMIPGLGFALAGRWRRGLAHFGIIMATFAMGLALQSAVLWPTWSMSAPDFNLINNFTFIVQMGAGLPALASFMAATGGDSGPALFRALAGTPEHPYFELGSYFLIVAGALNYFAVRNFFDRIGHAHGPFAEQEAPAEGAQA